MAKQTIDEVMEDYKDCQRCEDKSCLGMVSNCSKPDSIVQVESELLRTLIAEISLDRLEEICTAEKDGRCVVLPCKVGDTVYKTYFIHKCDRCPNNHVGSCKYDGQDVECPRSISGIREVSFNLDMFSIYTKNFKRGFYLTPEEAEAALAKEGDDERD